MSYVPGYVKIIYVTCILGLSACILRMVLMIDSDFKRFSGERIWKWWLLFSVLFSVEMSVFLLTDRQIHNISVLLMMVYFTVCSVMDVLLLQVNDFMQFVGVIAGGIRLMTGMPSEGTGIALIFFALIQYLVFRPLYGTADCMGFMICSLFSAGMDLGFESYLTSMLFCFCLVAAVQLLKNNVSQKGNLKSPIALYPYIGMSFWIWFL